MGVDYYAYAVIGCEITGKLHDKVAVRNCGCPPSEGKFCTHCGKQSNRTETRPKPFYDEDNDLIGNLMVRFTTDGERAFAGVSSSPADRDVGSVQLTEGGITRSFEDVRATLEPLGLWDPHKFGLWAVLRCSY